MARTATRCPHYFSITFPITIRNTPSAWNILIFFRCERTPGERPLLRLHIPSLTDATLCILHYAYSCIAYMFYIHWKSICQQVVRCTNCICNQTLPLVHQRHLSIFWQLQSGSMVISHTRANYVVLHSDACLYNSTTDILPWHLRLLLQNAFSLEIMVTA